MSARTDVARARFRSLFGPCPCRKLNPNELVMQSAENGDRHYTTEWLNGACAADTEQVCSRRSSYHYVLYTLNSDILLISGHDWGSGSLSGQDRPVVEPINSRA